MSLNGPKPTDLRLSDLSDFDPMRNCGLLAPKKGYLELNHATCKLNCADEWMD